MDGIEKLKKFYRRCDARLRGKLAYCKKRPLQGKTRCRLHGGASTGAITPEGKARSMTAMIEGKQRWLERLREERIS